MRVQKHIDRLIAERASEWLEILRSGKSEAMPEFVQWIGESPRHMQEFMALLALEEELPRAFAHAHIDRDALLARIRADVRPLADESLVSFTSRKPATRKIQWKTWKIAAAAAVIASIGSAAWIVVEQAGRTFSTAIGEQRTMALADGSLIYLNAHSVARVKLAKHTRDIQLLQGEALFQVAPDRQRPFRVRTQDAVVQVIGTSFNVDARHTRTVVSVLEGKVQVSSGAASRNVPAEPLSAGEAAEITREGTLRRHATVDVAGATAWRQRQLVFSKTSLEDVAADFNRFHRQGRMILQDIDAGSHHYTGTFDADDVASFALLLSKEKDLTIEERDGDYIIRPRTSISTNH